MKRKWDLFDFINVFLLGIFCVSIIYPFLHMAASSFSERLYVLQGKVTIFPLGFNLKSYEFMLMNKWIPLAFYNTLKYTVIGTFVNVVLTTISAYPLSKKNLFGRKIFMRMIVITLVFSGGLIPNYLLVASLGMIDSMWSLIIPQAIYGLYLIMAITFYQTIPAEIEESAHIDGASAYRILFSLIIPLSKPIIAALVLFYSMYHYNSFVYPLLYLQDKAKLPLQIVLRNMIILSQSTMTEARGGGGYMALSLYAQQSLKYATIFISIIPVLIAYPFVQKHFIKGVMIGAIKG